MSREKRPGFQHHKKAGAMNALVRFIFRFSVVPSFVQRLGSGFLCYETE